MYESCRLTRRANDQSHTAHAISPSPTTGTNVRTTRHESERSVVRPNIERTLVTILARWTTKLGSSVAATRTRVILREITRPPTRGARRTEQLSS